MPGLWEKCEIRCVPEPDEVGKTSQSEDVFHYPPQELYFYAQKKKDGKHEKVINETCSVTFSTETDNMKKTWSTFF